MSDAVAPRRSNPAPLFLVLGLVVGFLLGGGAVGGILFLLWSPLEAAEAERAEAEARRAEAKVRETLEEVAKAVQPSIPIDLRPPESRQVVLEFLENLRAGRADAGREKFASPSFQSRNPEFFNRGIERAALSRERSKAIDAEVTALPPIDSKTHQYRAVLPRKDKGSTVITLTLISSFSGWKIDECEFEEAP